VFKDLSKKFAAWFTKETIGNFLYELLGIAWKSAAVSAFVTLFLRLFRAIPFDAWFFIMLFMALALIFAMERYARRRGWLAFPVQEPKQQRPNPPQSAKSESVDLKIHDSIHGCPDENIHRLVDNDRLSVWRLLRFTVVRCELHIEADGPPPFIVFQFGVFSLTLREVSINDEIGGAIYFEVPKHGAWRLRRGIAIEYNEAKPILFREHCIFKVRQDLKREDADYIRENVETGLFKMDDLIIRLSGDGLDDPRLDTTFSVKPTEDYRPSLTHFLFKGM
jgi:hypothetical protein